MNTEMVICLVQVQSLTIRGILDSRSQVLPSYLLVLIRRRINYRFTNACHINNNTNTLGFHLQKKKKKENQVENSYCRYSVMDQFHALHALK